MPHFVLDCSENILELQNPRKVLQEILETAYSTGLFEKNDIKVRLNPFKHLLVQGSDYDFIHVFANIMEGRTTEQKSNLSKQVVKKLKFLYPEVPIISINIRDFERATYCNREMI